MFNYWDSDYAENTIRRVINITDFTCRLINVLIKKQMKACSFLKLPSVTDAVTPQSEDERGATCLYRSPNGSIQINSRQRW